MDKTIWCFVDESWHGNGREHIGVLAAAMGAKRDFDALDKEIYRVRKKYFGEAHARDLRSELKGKDLFSNFSFKQQQTGYSKNLSAAREILEWMGTSSIRLVAVCIYGDTKPPLLSSDLKLLSVPFRELCVRLWAQVPANEYGHLVFDQRLGAQEDISISIFNYLAGIKGDQRLLPHPLIGVSNVWSGLQLADMVAYIIGKYSMGDDRFDIWYRRLKKFQAEGKDHHGQSVFGFLRLQWDGKDQYVVRKIRTKK
ncbi:MAG: DUF3800 domain-containing protein [Verrucomicrobiota bacterium]